MADHDWSRNPPALVLVHLRKPNHPRTLCGRPQPGVLAIPIGQALRPTERLCGVCEKTRKRFKVLLP